MIMGTTHKVARTHRTNQIPMTLALTLILVALAGTALAQENMTILRSPAFDTHQRPPVPFVHDLHNAMAEIDDCAVCHHVYEDGVLQEYETSEDQPCSACHPVHPQDGELSLMRAFHKRCITCHDQTDKGPLTCGGCHVKE